MLQISMHHFDSGEYVVYLAVITIKMAFFFDEPFNG